MQLRKTVVLLTALSALSVVMTACDTGTTDETSCTTDSDCTGTTDVCHPTAKICVQSCTAAADCPDTAKTCAPFTGASKNICQCSTDQLCNGLGSTSTDLVCSSVDKVCESKCTSDAACGTGRTCDTATGQCKAAATCSPACGAGQTCDPQTNTCVSSGTACTGTSQSTCAYGQFCSGTTCADAPVAPATCENFSSNRPSWSTSSTGPVIYEVSLLRFEASSANCSSPGDAFITRVRAYRTDADWPASRSGVAGFFYVTTGGSQTDVVNGGLLIPNTGYNRNTSNLKDAEFQVALCRPLGSTTIQVGFYFTGGNPVCQQLNKP